MRKMKLTNQTERWMEERLADPTLRARVDQRMQELQLAEDLVALREAQGMTQRQLARLLDVSQPAIAKLESGQATNLRLKTLVRVTEALGGQLQVTIAGPGTRRRRGGTG